MNFIQRRARHEKAGDRLRFLLVALGCGGAFAGEAARGQERESLAGESAAQAVKKSLEAQSYDMRWGPVRLRSSASVGVHYTDNVFYSHNAQDDVMINPSVMLEALWPISEMNSLHVSLGLAYEWYLRHHILNADSPLINPGSEVAFHVFVGDFHLQVHDRFSYQQDLFFNSLFGDTIAFYNLQDVGVFSRLNNQAGLDATWDLNKWVFTLSYNHETFDAMNAPFDYLSRESELIKASAGYNLGDHFKVGVEDQTGVHNYHRETTLNDNWRNRVGPFVDVALPLSIQLQAGGGLETARYAAGASPNNDYTSYYVYAKLRQDLRFFSHGLGVGRELLLGDLANNMRNTYVRYSISSSAIAHLDLGANLSFNQGEEFGGPYDEKFTYYAAGFQVGYQIFEHWRADLSYEFRRKESSVALLDFHRNRVTLATTYTF